MFKPQTADIAAIIQASLDRYDSGRVEHGQLDLATDSRDFRAEAIEELQDCINYCVFQIIKLKGLAL